MDLKVGDSVDVPGERSQSIQDDSPGALLTAEAGGMYGTVKFIGQVQGKRGKLQNVGDSISHLTPRRYICRRRLESNILVTREKQRFRGRVGSRSYGAKRRGLARRAMLTRAVPQKELFSSIETYIWDLPPARESDQAQRTTNTRFDFPFFLQRRRTNPIEIARL